MHAPYHLLLEAIDDASEPQMVRVGMFEADSFRTCSFLPRTV